MHFALAVQCAAQGEPCGSKKGLGEELDHIVCGGAFFCCFWSRDLETERSLP